MISGDRVVLVATSSLDGVPHLAAAGGLTLVDRETVGLKDWLCFQSLDNLSENPRVAIALMEQDGSGGFQLIGRAKMSQVGELLDGYTSQGGKRKIAAAGKEISHRVRGEGFGTLSGPSY